MNDFSALPSDLAERLDQRDKQQLEHHAHEADEMPGKGFRPAAVLMPLLRRDEAWQLLFTRRSDNLMNHQGQVAFPGGGWEEDDPDLVATALRESWEEVGIRPTDVNVLGSLPVVGLITEYRVTPVVGIIPWPYELTLFHKEVARAFTVPLNWLANPANWYSGSRTYDGKTYELTYYQLYEGEKIWGATAYMTQQLLALLKD